MQRSFIRQRSDANTRTKQLYLLFALAILLTLLAYNGVIYLCFYLFNSPVISLGFTTVSQTDLTADYSFIIKFMLWFSLIYTAILVGTYLYHYRQLKDEPQYILYTLPHYHPLDEPRNFKERQLVNISEEMSVAAGQPVPQLYLLDNNLSINAFTYGFAETGYHICVTQGALDYLNRDELQALLAHEFGHITSDDVGINMRLSSILQSFFVMSNVKEFIRGSYHSSYDSGKGAAAVIIIYAFYYISLIMVATGKKLQGFISRTRETHADACAVQFTRNQDSLVSLLQKVYALQQFYQPNSHTLPQNFQHIQFSGHSKDKTHPPITERIKAYGGETDLSFIESLYYQLQQAAQKDLQAHSEKEASKDKQSTQETFERLLTTPILLPIVSGLLNQPNSYNYDSLDLREGVEQLTAILITIENLDIEAVKSHCQTLNLDLDKIANIQTQLRQKSHPILWIQRCRQIAQRLSQQNKYEKQLVMDFLNKLVKVDDNISVHEFSYLIVIHQALKSNDNAVDEPQKSLSISNKNSEITMLIHYLVSLNDTQNPVATFNYICEKLFGNQHRHDIEQDKVTQNNLYQSILSLQQLNKSEAKRLLDTLVDTILGDNQLNVAQYNLLYAIGTQLQLPLKLTT